MYVREAGLSLLVPILCKLLIYCTYDDGRAWSKLYLGHQKARNLYTRSRNLTSGLFRSEYLGTLDAGWNVVDALQNYNLVYFSDAARSWRLGVYE